MIIEVHLRRDIPVNKVVRGRFAHPDYAFTIEDGFVVIADVGEPGASTMVPLAHVDYVLCTTPQSKKVTRTK